MSSDRRQAFGGSQSGRAAEPSVFHGTTPNECEEFIASVRTYAKAKGKIRDNSWIADELYDAFRGRALRWYLKQPVEVRGDWESLQQAMMEEWSGDERLTPSPPAAASAPPLTISARSLPGQRSVSKVSSSVVQNDGKRRARLNCKVYLQGDLRVTICEEGDIVEVLDNSGYQWQVRTGDGVVGRLFSNCFELL